MLIVIVPETMCSKGEVARKELSDNMVRYNMMLRSFLDGLRIVKTYCYRKQADELLECANDFVEKTEAGRMGWQLKIQLVTVILQTMQSISILFLGVFLIYRGEIDVGNLLSVIQLAEIIGAPIEVLAYLKHSRNMDLLGKYDNRLILEDGKLNPLL